MISKILYSPAFVENYQWIKTFTVNARYDEEFVCRRMSGCSVSFLLSHREKMCLKSVGRI